MSRHLLICFSCLILSLPGFRTLYAQEEVANITTTQGRQLQIFSQLSPLEINSIHSWELLLLDNEGATIIDAEIEVSGGMPEHDHGMPTLPRVTGVLDSGRYLLQGVRFHMPGFWQLVFTIKTSDGIDSAELEFIL